MMSIAQVASLFGGPAKRRLWPLFLAVLLLLCWLSAALHIFQGFRLPFPSTSDSEAEDTKQTHDIAKPILSESVIKSDPSWYTSTEDEGKATLSNAEPKPAKLAEYTLKPVVYVFPQFHPIPENDKFWGENFTEWVNVKKLEKNRFGLDIKRPTEEVGYYNLLDISTRKRWTDTIKASEIYGIVYHHYWFGYPVMEKPLEAILSDGHPDVPFMLSWANEPWTVRWDGADMANGDGTLLAQTYGGIQDWKKHYDFLVPFFRHPNYMRVNGKVQMMIYNPSHIGDKGKRMFTAWRSWAAQDPTIGGMDVIETKIGGDDPDARGPTDAMNEFGFRSGGGMDHTIWPILARVHRVYHRGAMVTWDNSPRHATDGAAYATAWSHPELWKLGIIDLMHHIKSDPNPLGEENYLFINAFNEWGEGNTLEPTLQWGDKYLKALDAAKQYVDNNIPWRTELLAQGEELGVEVNNNNSRVDVCVIIREFHGTWPFEQQFTLLQTIQSLQRLQNKHWRGVVVPALSDADKRKIEVTVEDSYEPRIVVADVPEDVLESSQIGSDGAEVTDWVIENIDAISPSCGRARYLLVTNATHLYEPDTFDSIKDEDPAWDILGLNFVSEKTLKHEEARRDTNITWDQRCDRFENGATQICHAMSQDAEVLDLGAALVNMAKWRTQGHKLTGSVHETSGISSVLQQLATHAEQPWTWAPPAVDVTASCHLIHANSLTNCIRTGRSWVDLPEVEGFESGCFSGVALGEKYGLDELPLRWDYERFMQNPFCIRLSRGRYEEVTQNEALRL